MNRVSVGEAASVLHNVYRVIKVSGVSPWQFYQGIFFWTVERCVDVFPMLVFFFWLMLTINNDSRYSMIFFGVVLAFFYSFVFSFMAQRQSFLGGYYIMKNYRKKLIDHIRQLKICNVYQYRSGELAELLTDDIK